MGALAVVVALATVTIIGLSRSGDTSSDGHGDTAGSKDELAPGGTVTLPTVVPTEDGSHPVVDLGEPVSGDRLPPPEAVDPDGVAPEDLTTVVVDGAPLLSVRQEDRKAFAGATVVIEGALVSEVSTDGMWVGDGPYHLFLRWGEVEPFAVQPADRVSGRGVVRIAQDDGGGTDVGDLQRLFVHALDLEKTS